MARERRQPEPARESFSPLVFSAEIQMGETVEITGSFIDEQKTGIILARSLLIRGKTFVLRDKYGFPSGVVREKAVRLLKLGAYDYLTKTLELDELYHTIGRALETVTLAKENRRLHEGLREKFSFGN